MSLQHARIAARAHDLWELRGRPDGSSEIDWYQAEKQLNGDANDPSEPKTTLDPLAQQVADVLKADVDVEKLVATPPAGPLPKRSRSGRNAAGQHRENGAARE